MLLRITKFLSLVGFILCCVENVYAQSTQQNYYFPVYNGAKFVCDESCAQLKTRYDAADDKQYRECVAAATAQGFSASTCYKSNTWVNIVVNNPAHLCNQATIAKLPVEYQGCNLGHYPPQKVPNGFTLSNESCGGCPVYMGARWCEKANAPAASLYDAGGKPITSPQYVTVSAGLESPVSYQSTYFNALNGKQYLINALPDEYTIWSWQRDIFPEASIDFYAPPQWRCCEDRDGDGMPGCTGNVPVNVVSATDATKVQSIAGGGGAGPDCDDFNPTVTPASVGPKILSVEINKGWVSQRAAEGRITKETDTTVYTPIDVTVNYGMCWMDADKPPFRLAVVTASTTTPPVYLTSAPSTQMMRVPEYGPPAPGSGAEYLQPIQPGKFYNQFGSMTSGWADTDAKNDQIIDAIADGSAINLKLEFNLAPQIASFMPIGVTNCFRLYGDGPMALAMMRGESLGRTAGDFLRTFMLPFTDPRPTAPFSVQKVSLPNVRPFKQLPGMVSFYFDLGKTKDSLWPTKDQVTASGTTLYYFDAGNLTANVSCSGIRYYAFINGRLDIVPAYTLGRRTPFLNYGWLFANTGSIYEVAASFIHELVGHTVGKLDDEYLYSNARLLSSAPRGDAININCVPTINPFKYNNVTYATPVTGVVGCSRSTSFVHPTVENFMTVRTTPAGREFNDVGCGHIAGQILGTSGPENFEWCAQKRISG